MKNKIITLIALSLGGSLAASPIASESFATPGGYVSGTSFGSASQNQNNIIGTTGFSTSDNWNRNSALVTPRDTDSLTHNLMVGTAFSGGARVRSPGGATGTRASYRALDSIPTGLIFYMSGLVSVRGDADNMHMQSDAQIGLSTFAGLNDQVGNNSYSPGFFLGLSRATSGAVNLAAFAGGNTYTLGNELTGAALAGAHMIVLRAELGQSPGANDTLTAWYALAGESELTLGGSWSGINIADSGSDMEAFGLRGATFDTDAEGVPDGVAFDEWRFGSTMGAVAIPEPSTVGIILGLMVFIPLWVRSRISR